MNIEKLKNKKNECRAWKNVAPWYNELQNAQKIEKKDLKVDFGDWFGESGKGHIRVNLATTPENIKKAVSALVNALKSEN